MKNKFMGSSILRKGILTLVALVGVVGFGKLVFASGYITTLYFSNSMGYSIGSASVNTSYPNATIYVRVSAQGDDPNPSNPLIHLKVQSGCPTNATCNFTTFYPPGPSPEMVFSASSYSAYTVALSMTGITVPGTYNLTVYADVCNYPGSADSKTCTYGSGPGQTISIPIYVTGNPPTVSLSASPTSGTEPLNTTLTWSTGNSPTSCTAGGNWSGSKSTTGGSQTITGLTAGSYTYTLYCTNSAGNSSTVSVPVTVAAAPTPTATLTGTVWQSWSGSGRDTAWVYNNATGPFIVYSGAPFALNWTSSNTTSCAIDSKTETPVAGGTDNTYTAGGGGWSHTYTLSCKNTAGTTVTKTLAISVPPNPSNVTGSCSSNGQTFSLSWTLPAGYTQAYVRVHDETNNTYPIYIDGYTGTSYSGTVTPYDKYSYWVHTYAPNGAWSDGIGSTDGQPTNVTCTVANTAPHGSGGVGTGPTVTGPTTGYNNNSYTFTASATDDQNNQIRYGFDWNMDGIADTWVPANLGYVNSGTSQSTSYSWSTSGSHTFQVLAQDTVGANSPWTQYQITTSNQVFPPTVSISASPSTMTLPSNSTTLTWSTTNSPDTCSASGAWTGSENTTGGTQTISGLTANSYDFSITCSNSAGQASSNAHVVVNPALPTYSLNVTNTYGGTVKSADNYLACGTTCSHTYTQGDVVTLTAIPTSSQWTFAGWSGACTGTGSCTITMNAAKTVTALFTLHPLNYQEF